MNISVPELFSLGDLFALLRNPKTLLDGLSGFFSVTDDLAKAIDNVEIPLIGGGPFDNLSSSLSRIREGVLGEQSNATFRHDDGVEVYTHEYTYLDGIGAWLQEQISNDVTDVFEGILAEIRQALWNGLSPLNSSENAKYFSLVVPDRASPNDPLRYDDQGKVLTRPAESADDIQLITAAV